MPNLSFDGRKRSRGRFYGRQGGTEYILHKRADEVPRLRTQLSHWKRHQQRTAAEARWLLKREQRGAHLPCNCLVRRSDPRCPPRASLTGKPWGGCSKERRMALIGAGSIRLTPRAPDTPPPPQAGCPVPVQRSLVRTRAQGRPCKS